MCVNAQCFHELLLSLAHTSQLIFSWSEMDLGKNLYTCRKFSKGHNFQEKKKSEALLLLFPRNKYWDFLTFGSDAFYPRVFCPRWGLFY